LIFIGVYYQSGFEVQILIYQKLIKSFGHHVLRPETAVDWIADVIKNDDLIKLYPLNQSECSLEYL